MTTDAQRLEEFAVAFAKIPQAKSVWFSCARQHGRVTRFYQALDDCRSHVNEAHDVMASLNGVSCSSSGSVAALVRHFAVEMKNQGIVISIGNSYTQSIIDAVAFYNDLEDLEVPDLSSLEDRVTLKDRAIGKHPDLAAPYKMFESMTIKLGTMGYGDNVTFRRPNTFKQYYSNEVNTMGILDKFSKKALVNVVVIFGRLADDMDEDDYLAAIRQINTEIEAIADIKGSKKVAARIVELKEQLIAVTAMYDKS